MFRLCAILIAVIFCILPNADAAFVVRDGWAYEVSERATETAEIHFQRAIDAYRNCDWAEAAREFRLVVENFPKNALVPKCYYYLGECQFKFGEYDLANADLNSYLRETCEPDFFEEVIQLKFQIAEALRCGARRHPYCSRRFPKILRGYDLAIEIYDELIATVPCQEVAALSLFAKGRLLAQQFDYRCAIEAFLGLIRRFPKHELAPDSYKAMLEVYRSQASFEVNNPDILDLAEITYTHFCSDYPNDDRLVEASEIVMTIRERYAYGLFSTGEFYERVCKPASSMLYYISAIERFPDTKVADCARRRLCLLQQKHRTLAVPEGLL